ncbi:hypothetical protein F4861DRAFT_389819 [Xylaria intraflava]|nr:hypothetical protein F4861DRAFT_389819 [Xylaria intraflava]
MSALAGLGSQSSNQSSNQSSSQSSQSSQGQPDLVARDGGRRRSTCELLVQPTLSALACPTGLTSSRSHMGMPKRCRDAGRRPMDPPQLPNSPAEKKRHIRYMAQSLQAYSTSLLCLRERSSAIVSSDLLCKTQRTASSEDMDLGTGMYQNRLVADRLCTRSEVLRNPEFNPRLETTFSPAPGLSERSSYHSPSSSLPSNCPPFQSIPPSPRRLPPLLSSIRAR